MAAMLQQFDKAAGIFEEVHNVTVHMYVCIHTHSTHGHTYPFAVIVDIGWS